MPVSPAVDAMLTIAPAPVARKMRHGVAGQEERTHAVDFECALKFDRLHGIKIVQRSSFGIAGIVDEIVSSCAIRMHD
jgi:hypothetical protein